MSQNIMSQPGYDPEYHVTAWLGSRLPCHSLAAIQNTMSQPGCDPDYHVTAGYNPEYHVTAGCDPEYHVTAGYDPDYHVTAWLRSRISYHNLARIQITMSQPGCDP